MQQAKLKNWYFDSNGRLNGEVFDHPVHSNGKEVMCSRVLEVKTRNTEYKLLNKKGEPENENEQSY